MLVFEDVHWADHLTLDFVKYLARRIHGWPALLCLSYRNDEVGPMHPLTQVLGELPAGATAAVDLRPLSTRAIQQLSGWGAREAGELLRVTDGNPFFVTELVAAAEHDPTLRDARSFVPVTVATAVLARAQRVSPPARKVLEVASLSPGSIDVALLSALAGPGTPEGVDECVEAGLLRWTEQGFAFRHELARQAIEHSLTPMRRRAMHARVYEQLRLDADNVLDRMAYHARHAHDSQAVLSIAPLIAGVLVTALEVLVAAIQAWVFALLTCIYLNDAINTAMGGPVTGALVFQAGNSSLLAVIFHHLTRHAVIKGVNDKITVAQQLRGVCSR